MTWIQLEIDGTPEMVAISLKQARLTDCRQAEVLEWVTPVRTTLYFIFIP